MTENEKFEYDTLSDWKSRVEKELKGRPLQKLYWKNEAGIELQPYYTRENSATPYPVFNRENLNGRQIYERIEIATEAEMNAKALNALNSGATALSINWDEKLNLALILKGVELAFIEIGFNIPVSAIPGFTQQFKGLIEQRKLKKEEIHGFVALTDPHFNEYNRLISALSDFPHIRTAVCNAVYWREDGAGPVLETALALAQAHEILLDAHKHGVSNEMFASKFQFNLGIGADYFLEISRLRSVNTLWKSIVEKYGNFSPAFLFALTSNYQLTWLDQNNNLLRNTNAGMAAACGGANGLLILPHSIGNTTERDSRIARNIALVMQHEAKMDKVQDPAKGSWYIETLSTQFAEECWGLFLEIEAQGGYEAALKNGFVSENIQKNKNRVLEEVNSGKRFVLGVNQFPSERDKPKEREQESFVLSRDFEDLKASVLSSGKPPKALLLLFGDKSAANARANFSRNFLGCAGFQFEEQSADEMNSQEIQALTNEYSYVVLCSSDQEYHGFFEKHGPINDTFLIIAGTGSGREEELQKLGVKMFINRSTPLLESLQQILKEGGKR